MRSHSTALNDSGSRSLLPNRTPKDILATSEAEAQAEGVARNDVALAKSDPLRASAGDLETAASGRVSNVATQFWYFSDTISLK